MCPQYNWGNDPLTSSNGCIDIEESYLKPSDPLSIVLILLGIIGLLAVVYHILYSITCFSDIVFNCSNDFN